MIYLCIKKYNSAIKENEILPFTTTCMDLERIMPSEISHSEKGKYHMILDGTEVGGGWAGWGMGLKRALIVMSRGYCV